MCDEVFRQWVLAQHVEGYRISQADETHILLDGKAFLGEVNFHAMGDGSEIVEMLIVRRSDDEPAFFLHFMMEDIERARELFGEMREALSELASDRRVRVLLCCTCGITTTMFATKMNGLSEALDLGYDVFARPLGDATDGGESPDVVMLAPQAAHERSRIARLFPDAIVFEIPARVFGSFDAAAGVRLVANALDHHNVRTVEGPGRRAMPDHGAWGGRIMVVSAVHGARRSTISYRIFDDAEQVLEGRSTKHAFDFRDIEDLLAAVRLQGVDVGTLDAIGIAVPGIVDKSAVSLFHEGVHGYDLGSHIQEAYGVPVFLDNDANAAAMGCYATQSSYRSICFHRESFGHEVGGQGTVIDGRLNAGRKNFAGEADHLMGVLRWSDDPRNLAWIEDGMYELVSRYLLLAAVEVAPEAIYVDAWPVTDMARLGAELSAHLGEEYTPDLIPAPDFTERILLGELALCEQRLHKEETSRRHPTGRSPL